MTSLRPPAIPSHSPAREWLDAIRHYLRGRRGLMIAAGAVLAIGLATNWSWLVAVGLAPLLLGVLPCLAMCALGLCMNRTAGRSSAAETAPRVEPAATGTRPVMPAEAAVGFAASTVAIDDQPPETRRNPDA